MLIKTIILIDEKSDNDRYKYGKKMVCVQLQMKRETMKSLIFLAVLGLVQANVDWSKITPLHPVLTPPPNFRKPEINNRIVGGAEAKPNSIPYQAALFIDSASGLYFCGGSLISENYVLTAAHCIDSKSIGPISNVKVILGAHEVRAVEATQQIIISTEFQAHENYDSSQLINDVALVKLPEAAILNDYVATIALPAAADQSDTFENATAEVSGWGKTSDEATGIAEKLHVVQSSIISNVKCNDWYFGSIGVGHICLYGETYKSPCNGDSGGPLVSDNKQIGIVSFGIIFGCQAGWPGAFTRVTEYRDWIIANSDVQ